MHEDALKGNSIEGLRPIGWREWVALPSLSVEAIKAKIDTGAGISALHASHIEVLESDGQQFLRFRVYPKQRDDSYYLTVQAPAAGQRLVRSSSGHEETRWIIRSVVRFAELEWPIELGLTTRQSMGFRLLLGRAAVAEHFFVQPAASFLGGSLRRTLTRQMRRQKEQS